MPLALIGQRQVGFAVTGTYAISVFQQDASKYYSTTYTVNSANTWEYKTVKINGNTSDVINNDNGSGLRLSWTLSSGSNFTSGSNDAWGDSTNWAVGHNASWITTSSATFFLTGVQLEVGEQATPFEHRSFGEELALCQRYCFRINDNGSDAIQIGNGYYVTATTTRVVVTFPVTMRGIPTVTTLDAGLGILRANVVDNSVTLDAASDQSTYSTGLNLSDCASDTIGEGIVLRIINGTSGFLEADAEL